MPFSISTVWGYFRTVPNRMVLCYGFARLRGRRPGLCGSESLCDLQPSLRYLGDLPTRQPLSATAPSSVKPGWDYLPFFWLHGVVTHRAHKMTDGKSTNCSASYRVSTEPCGEHGVKPSLHPLVEFNFSIINCYTLFSFQYILYIRTIFMSSFQSFLISVRLGGKLTR